MKQTLAIPGILIGIPFIVHYDLQRFIDDVLLKGEYQPYVDAIPHLKDRDNLIVLDIGCNIGTFSLSVYDHCQQIYAVDISRRCIELLNNTINDNHLTEIQTFHQGISGANKKVRITTSKNETDGGLSIYGDGEEMDTVTLASFINQNAIDHVDLIKIDVEGAEYEIFDTEDFAEVKNRIGAVIGEYHKGNIPPGLAKHGFECTQGEGIHFSAINPNYKV